MTTEDAIEALEALATDADDFGSTRYRMADADAIRVVLNRLRELEGSVRGYQKEIREAEKVLGKALGFPWYKDDLATFPGATEDDGVCTGNHTIVSLAEAAADRLRELEADKRECQGLLDRIDNQVGETLERIGHSPGPPAGFPDRLDTLCRLVGELDERLRRVEWERDRLIERWPRHGEDRFVWQSRSGEWHARGFPWASHDTQAAAVRSAAGLNDDVKGATDGE